MKINLRAGLDYVMVQGLYRGMTLRDAIIKDPWYIDKLRNENRIKIDADALCFLINKRSEILNKYAKICDLARKKEDKNG